MSEPGLQGKRILLTRPLQQSAAWAQNLSAAGAIPIIFPLISINSITPDTSVIHAIEQLDNYDYIIFTSVNGARYFIDLLNDDQKHILRQKQIAVVGIATAKYLEENGITIAFIPDTYTAIELANYIPITGIEKCLIPTTATARENLPQLLREKGAELDIINVYSNTPRNDGAIELAHLFNKGIDIITFASPSAIQGYVNLIGETAPECIIACIGPVTAEKAQKYGWQVDIIANTHTAEGLSHAIKTYYDYDKQTQKA